MWTLPRIGIPSFWHVCLVILFVVYIWSKRKQYWLSWQLPGPLALPLIGNALVILNRGVSNALGISDILLIEYRGPSRLVRFWNFTELLVLIGDASVAHQVNRLLTKPDVYEALGGYYLKQGVVMDTCNPDSHHWKMVKKAYMPSFSLEHLKSYVQKFHEDSLMMCTMQLEKYAQNGESFHPLQTCQQLAFHSATKTLFGTDLRTSISQMEAQHIMRLLEAIFENFQKRIIPVLRNMILYTILGLRQREKKEMHYVLDFIEDVIENKKTEIQENSKSGSTTQMSMIERFLKDPDFPKDQLKVQGATFMAAGIDTLKSEHITLFLMLAIHPDVQNKLYNEILDVLGHDVTQVPTYEDLMKMEYLDRVIKECFRKYPAAPLIAKKVEQDLTVLADDGEYMIPGGTTAVILISNIHNNPDYYENPDQFDPDRWLPEPTSRRHPHSFLAFSNGPRNCPGGKYAILQMKTFFSTLVRKFEILPTDMFKSMEDVKYEMRMTIKFADNCRVKLRRRVIS